MRDVLTYGRFREVESVCGRMIIGHSLWRSYDYELCTRVRARTAVVHVAEFRRRPVAGWLSTFDDVVRNAAHCAPDGLRETDEGFHGGQDGVCADEIVVVSLAHSRRVSPPCDHDHNIDAVAVEAIETLEMDPYDRMVLLPIGFVPLVLPTHTQTYAQTHKYRLR